MCLDTSAIFPRMADFPQWSTTHLTCGGVTNGAYTFFTPLADCGTDSVTPGLPRRLRHVIETTTKTSKRLKSLPVPLSDSTQYDTPWYVDSTRRTLDWNGLLPVQAPLTPVRCQSVYTSTGWTSRGLTVVELGKAFDVPSMGFPIFDTWPWPEAHKKGLPFLHSVPLLVLRQAWGVLAGGGALSAESSGCTSTPNKRMVSFAPTVLRVQIDMGGALSSLMNPLDTLVNLL